MTDDQRPKLRRVQVSRGRWRGQDVVVVQDPLGLCDRVVAVPIGLAPILELCDGTRDVATLRTALELRTGMRLGPQHVDDMISELDQALLLENERSAQAYRDTVDQYRAASARPPVLAGSVYPVDSSSLERALDGYFAGTSPRADLAPDVKEVRGLVSPHIDYQRGGAVYADVWRQAASAAKSADIAIILGTDHYSGRRLLTLTRQNYSTPWGVIPTAGEVVNEVVGVLGEEEAFAEELHHRTEHSVEIAAVWLHYLTRVSGCTLLPVLCGSMQDFVEGERGPGGDEKVALFVEAVRKAVGKRRALVVAAGDLAHVGPAFGDAYPIGVAEKASLSAADKELMAAISSGDAEAVFSQVKREGDRRRICGLAPIYLALRLLGQTEGRVAGYAQCPADQQETSFVSICGIVFT